MELADFSLTELSEELQAGGVSPLEATEACLRRIEERDPILNSFLTVTAEAALQEARARGEELARGESRGPLHGVPVAVKDLYLTRGIRTTAGSAVLRDWIPDTDATVVTRLREAGAVLLGKNHMHEFAFGATNENPHYGPCRNPHNPECITGGSSGGSGAAVAAGLCYGSLGSDTGGSIRCPAALCGIVGLKATYGRVPRTGVIPLGWTLDHVGPLTRTVNDAALMLEAIAGADGQDPSAVGSAWRAPELTGEVRGLRLGVPREFFWDVIHPGVEARVLEAIRALEQAGAEIREVSLPCLEWAGAAYMQLVCAEAAAYHREQLRTRYHDYGPNVRTRLVAALEITATEYLDALRARRIIQREFLNTLKEVDALLTPSVPVPAPPVGAKEVSAGRWAGPPQAFMVRNLCMFNMAGIPAVSVPCGFTEGLPVGLHIAGRTWEEAQILNIARAVELLHPFRSVSSV